MKQITKWKLPFVKNGEEFVLPKLTLSIHEKAMDIIGGFGKMPEEEYSRLLNKHIVVEILKTIDDKVTLDNINNMHPQDYLEIFGDIWNSGLVRKSDRSFRQNKK